MSSYGLRKSGITKDTPENLLFNAGTIYKNLKWNKTGKAWEGQLIGATSGGSKLSIIPEIKDVEVDGASVKVKGLTQKTGETGKLEINLAEVTPGALKMAIIGEEAESDIEGFDLLKTKPLLEDEDYCDNIAYVGYKADNTPVIVIMENALCTSGLEIEGKNKENAVIKVVFECYAGFDDDHDVLPIFIYTPTRGETQEG